MVFLQKNYSNNKKPFKTINFRDDEMVESARLVINLFKIMDLHLIYFLI